MALPFFARYDMKIKLNWAIFIKGVSHEAEEVVDVIENEARYLLGIGAARKPADVSDAPKAAPKATAEDKPATKASAKK